MTEVDIDRMERELRQPWRDISSAPMDGTLVRLHRIGRYRPYPTWVFADLGRYEVKPDGFKGWFNDAGEYLTPAPDSWLPHGLH